MVTEIAFLCIKEHQSNFFETAFKEAASIISNAKGCKVVELQKCIERDDTYLLRVQWNSLEDHTIGFRQSEAYQKWKSLLHHFYDPLPLVEHFTKIY
jgi:heme-degrading monooxygenase HmoA